MTVRATSVQELALFPSLAGKTAPFHQKISIPTSCLRPPPLAWRRSSPVKLAFLVEGGSVPESQARVCPARVCPAAESVLRPAGGGVTWFREKRRLETHTLIHKKAESSRVGREFRILDAPSPQKGSEQEGAGRQTAWGGRVKVTRGYQAVET